MKTVSDYKSFESFVKSANKTFLLLYRDGNPKSDCAFSELKASADLSEINIATANVNSVRDIHERYNIKSVPTLLEFERGALKNVVKGCQGKAIYSTIFNNGVSGEDNNLGSSKQVIVYTTPSCTYCHAIKNYLSGQGIAFREIDISRDEGAASDMIRRSGQQGVPQTVIDGKLVIGYDKNKLDKYLEIQ